MGGRKNTEWFIVKAKEIHGEKCSGGQAPREPITITNIIANATKIHNNLYDYSLTKKDFINMSTKVRIGCPEHGIFEQSMKQHIHKERGCPECGKIKSKTSLRSNTEAFVGKATKKHGNRYDYSKVNYIDQKTNVSIRCIEHNEWFEQPPKNHLKGCGCPTCAKVKCLETHLYTTEEFISKANKIHDNLYDYSLSVYVGSREPITIICSTHGEFSQKPFDHLQGNGCKKCSHAVSNMEIEWLNLMGVPDDNDHRQVKIMLKNGMRSTVDGFNPITNTVYEFNGDYWHGNPEVFDDDEKLFVDPSITFASLYKKTLKREEMIRKSGYNLVIMWERDFLIMKDEYEAGQKVLATSSA
jgi:hypothetical protein